MTTIKLASGKLVNVKPITEEDFKKVRGFVSEFFESGNFPFDYSHGNIAKTDFGISMYTTVDPFEKFFMESITIRVSDHSVGHRRAANEICFRHNASKDSVFQILGLKFNQYKK